VNRCYWLATFDLLRTLKVERQAKSSLVAAVSPGERQVVWRSAEGRSMPLFVAEEQSRSDSLGVKDGKTMNNKSGWLWKKRDYLPGARKRFFTLEGTRLSYHSSKPEQSTAVPRASFDLKGCFAAVCWPLNVHENSTVAHAHGHTYTHILVQPHRLLNLD
jgi:hypothetical protein